MRQIWILIIISIHFGIGTAIMFSTLGYTILLFWVCKKNFSSHRFPHNQSSSWKKKNLDTRNNLYSFVIGTTIKFFTLGYMIMMLWFGKKSFSFTIFLITKVHLWMKQTWILIIISILFVIGTIIKFFTLGYTILMLWFGRKSFYLCNFPYY